MYNRYKIEDGLFQTSDIDLITALSLIFPIIDIKTSSTNKMRVLFYFDATDELTDYVEQYRRREITVEPKQYYFQLRDIRSQINDLLDKEN